MDSHARSNLAVPLTNLAGPVSFHLNDANISYLYLPHKQKLHFETP